MIEDSPFFAGQRTTKPKLRTQVFQRLNGARGLCVHRGGMSSYQPASFCAS